MTAHAAALEEREDELATAPIARNAIAELSIESPTPTEQQRAVDITTLISSPSGLRDAVVLREILGPPRSLQSLDLLGSA